MRELTDKRAERQRALGMTPQASAKPSTVGWGEQQGDILGEAVDGPRIIKKIMRNTAG